MNSVIDALLNRRSTRSFLPDPVPVEDIDKILRCAQWAPSGSNQQPWHFIVIRNRATIIKATDIIISSFNRFLDTLPNKTIKQKVSAYKKYLDFISSAPVLICVLVQPYKSYLSKLLDEHNLSIHFDTEKVYPEILSVGAAIQNILIGAQSLGYSTCWMTGPLMFQTQLETFFNVQPPYTLVSLIPLGKSISKNRSTRKTLNKICTFID